MRKGYYLAILLMLIICSMALTASALPTDRRSTSRYSNGYGNENGQESNQMAQNQNQVTLTLYVLDGGMNGELLPGVDVTVYDAAGNSIGGVTDSKGSIVLSGQPGTWQFTLAKDGYKTSNLKYTITKSQVAATYLQSIAQSASPQTPAETATYSQGTTESTQPAEATQTVSTTQPAQSQEPVSLKIDVYESSLNGTALSGVQVTGQDAAGNSFEGTTDSNGAVVLSGQPGTWQFTFTKEGYQTLNLNYNVTETEEVAAFLQKAAQSASPQTPAETATYSQGTTESTQPAEATQTVSTTQPAQSQEPVSLKIDIYESSLNGTALSGVQVTGQDAAGNSFEGATDSNGAVVLSGQPGTWQFTFTKEGYQTLNLNYNVTETEEVAAFLQKAAQSTPQSITQTSPQSQGLVDFTVYVHQGDLNGTALSGVQVTGQDAVGNNFSAITDSGGSAVVSGQPGTWQFSFAKDGYGTLNLSYNVTQTDYGDVYLQSADQSTQSEVPVVSQVAPTQTYQQPSLQPAMQTVSATS